MILRFANKKLDCFVIPLIKLVKVPIGGYCKQDEQCHGSENLGVCEQHRCVCKTGYILSNFECHEGKLNMLFKIHTNMFKIRRTFNQLILYEIEKRYFNYQNLCSSFNAFKNKQKLEFIDRDL